MVEAISNMPDEGDPVIVSCAQDVGAIYEYVLADEVRLPTAFSTISATLLPAWQILWLIRGCIALSTCKQGLSIIS